MENIESDTEKSNQLREEQQDLLLFLYENFYLKQNNYIPCMHLQGRCFLITSKDKNDYLDVERPCVRELFAGGHLEWRRHREIAAVTNGGAECAKELIRLKTRK